MFNRKFPLHHSTEASTTSNLEYLASHSWERIMWYRSEMWRVTMLLYSGLAGLFLVCFKLKINGIVFDQTFISAEVIKVILAVSTAFIGGLIIILYHRYISKMYDAAKEQNQVHQDRIRHLSREQGLENTNGFRDYDELTCSTTNKIKKIKDTSYAYLNQIKPTLVGLKTSIAILILLFAVIGLLSSASIAA